MDSAEEKYAWKAIDFKDVKIGKRIGGGGVGIIYQGQYRNCRVALKTLFDPRVDDELKQQYVDELLVMSELQHPNIIRCIGACLDPPNLCIVMELAECSLYDILHRSNANIRPKQVIKYAMDMAQAMSYLHSRQPCIVHRDLKSHNLLLGFNGDLKLCDFGLVRTREISAGTPCYMPPELLQGISFSKAVDVYMFSMVLWEMFSRTLPFEGFDSSDIKRKVVAGIRPRIPNIGCPLQCQTLIRCCWDADASMRPEFSDILRELAIIYDSQRNTTEIECANAIGDSLDSLL